MPEITVNPAPEEKKPEAAKTEEVQSVNLRPNRSFKLPDGRIIDMGKPTMPSAMLLPSIIAGMQDKDKPSDAARNEFNARLALFVRSIDGKMTILPSSAAEVGVILQQLGEDGVDVALDAYFKHYAPISSDGLEVLKK